MSVSNDVLVIVVVAALTFLMWLMLRETFGAPDPHRRLPAAPRHLSALRVSRDLVDRLRLRLLVEPDLGRGSHAHRARRAAGGRARRQRA